MEKIFSSKKIQILLNIIIVYFLLLTFMPTSLMSSDYTYGIEHIHKFNPELFIGNTSVTGITPRFFTNFLIASIMKIFRVSWVTASIFYIFLSIIPYSIGITNLIFRIFKKHQLVFSIILSIFLAKSITAGLALISTFSISVLCLGTASGMAVLAISFCFGENKRWDIAWIIISFTIFLHIHEGIWGAGIIFILCCLEIYNGKSIKILRGMIIWLLAGIICALPSMIEGGSNLSNEEFVNIYANLRTAHHLVPSRWGIDNIILYFLLLLYPAILLFYIKNNNIKKCVKNIKIYIFCFLGSWILALMITFIFTELIPVSFIVTMYVPKYFKYVSFLAMILYLFILYNSLEEKKYNIFFLVFIFALNAKKSGLFSVVLFIFLYIIIKQENKKETGETIIFTILYYICCTYWGVAFSKQFCFGIIGVGIILIVNYDIFSYKVLYKLKGLVCITCIIFIILSGSYGKVYYFKDGIRIKVPNEYLLASTSESICNLANNLKEITKVNEGFLSDPLDENAGWLQILSERNCYVLWKTTPSSSAAIEEWYNRYLKVVGLHNKDNNEIIEIMKETNNDYILVPEKYKAKYINDNRFIKLLDELEYSIFRLK